MTAAKLLTERLKTAALYPDSRHATGWQKPRPARPNTGPAPEPTTKEDK